MTEVCDDIESTTNNICIICSDEISDKDRHADDNNGNDVIASVDEGAQHSVQFLKCDHQSKFHKSCLKQWTVRKLQNGESASCPLCRVEYAKSKYVTRRTHTTTGTLSVLDRFHGFKYVPLITMILAPLSLLATPVDFKHITQAITRQFMLLCVWVAFQAVQYYHYAGIFFMVVSLCCAVGTVTQGYMFLHHSSDVELYGRCYAVSFCMDVSWMVVICLLGYKMYSLRDMYLQAR